MPRYITDPDILEAMGRVENAEWMAKQIRAQREGPSYGEYGQSLTAAVRRRERSGEILEDFRASGELPDFDPCGDYRREALQAAADEEGRNYTDIRTIYGSGGYTRYFIEPADGEIIFSRHHTILNRLELAKAEGFRIG